MANPLTQLKTATDAQLVAATLEGNLRAYDEIVNRHQQMLAACLFRFASNQSELEDFVQETFIRAFRKLEKWKDHSSFQAWLKRVGYHLACDHLRKQRRNPLKQTIAKGSPGGEQSVQDSSELLRDWQPTADHLSAQRDLIDWLLSQLTPEESLLMTLMHVEQCSVQEMVQRTGWSESKIKVKLHRARKKLRNRFEEHERLSASPQAAL